MSFLARYKKRIMFESRRKKCDHFYSLCLGHERVLALGVSSEEKVGLEARNFFLKTFRFPPIQYTGLAIEDVSKMGELFPGKSFLQYSGGVFPFKDKEFDIVHCNAVIEHVGNEDSQLQFLNEMIRVGKVVYFTTPNKFFPIETHTTIPFLHWSDSIFYAFCRKFNFPIRKENLFLFSYGRLKRIIKSSRCKSHRIFKNTFLGITMTFTVVCADSDMVNGF